MMFPLRSLAGYVEALASKLGMQVPDLTPKQVDMWQTRLSSHLVRWRVVRGNVACDTVSSPSPVLLLRRAKPSASLSAAFWGCSRCCSWTTTRTMMATQSRADQDKLDSALSLPAGAEFTL